VPWGEDLIKLIRRYTTNPEVQASFDLTAELERRRLLEPYGRRKTAPVRFRQALDDYVEHWHSRQSLARERMTSESAAASGPASASRDGSCFTTDVVDW
jgi:hypothetical protein